MTHHDKRSLQLATDAVGYCRGDVLARDLAEASEALVRTIAARDLDGAPVYVVVASELPFGLIPSTFAGWTAPRLCWAIRSPLGQRCASLWRSILATRH
jgi:hypothetical protein